MRHAVGSFPVVHGCVRCAEARDGYEGIWRERWFIVSFGFSCLVVGVAVLVLANAMLGQMLSAVGLFAMVMGWCTFHGWVVHHCNPDGSLAHTHLHADEFDRDLSLYDQVGAMINIEHWSGVGYVSRPSLHYVKILSCDNGIVFFQHPDGSHERLPVADLLRLLAWLAPKLRSTL